MPEIDFVKIFALIVKRKLLQIYLSLILLLNLFIYHQVNIIKIYLKSLLGDNEYKIFMKLPLKI